VNSDYASSSELSCRKDSETRKPVSDLKVLFTEAGSRTTSKSSHDLGSTVATE